MSYYFTKERIGIALNIKSEYITKMDVYGIGCVVTYLDYPNYEMKRVTLDDMIKTRKDERYTKDLEVNQLSESCYKVYNTNKDSEYHVKLDRQNKKFSCNCKDFYFQTQTLGLNIHCCKHIYKTMATLNITDKQSYINFFEKLEEQLLEEVKVEEVEENTVNDNKEMTTINIDNVIISFPKDKAVNIVVNGVHIQSEPSKKEQNKEVKTVKDTIKPKSTKSINNEQNIATIPSYKSLPEATLKRLGNLIFPDKKIEIVNEDDYIEQQYQKYLERKDAEYAVMKEY